MDDWYTISPIKYTHQNDIQKFPDKFYFGHNLYLQRMPTWLTSQKVINPFGENVLADIIKSNHAFVLKYKADALDQSQQDAIQKIYEVNLAFWLIKPSSVKSHRFIHVRKDHNKFLLRQSGSFQELTTHEMDDMALLKPIDFREAKTLFNIMAKERKDCSLWMAIRTLWSALITPVWEVRFLFLWIVLEALFGTDTEINFKLSQRISFFLSRNRREAKNTRTLVSKLYGYRNDIVHGMRIFRKLKKEDSAKALHDLESIARKALSKILSEWRTRKLINSKNNEREAYLDDLLYRMK